MQSIACALHSSMVEGSSPPAALYNDSPHAAIACSLSRKPTAVRYPGSMDMGVDRFLDVPKVQW